jgi:hypothetical protein
MNRLRKLYLLVLGFRFREYKDQAGVEVLEVKIPRWFRPLDTESARYVGNGDKKAQLVTEWTEEAGGKLR